MSSKIVNLFIILIGSLLTLGLMKLTYDGFQQKIIHQHFSVPKIGKNEDAKLNLFFKIGLYFALFTIVLKIHQGIFNSLNILQHYSSTINRILLNSYDYFIIVFLILFYLLRNKNDFEIKKKAPLFGFWFIFGRVIYAIGYLLTTLTGLNLKVPGVAITYFTIALMISEAFGFNGFKFFDLIPSFGEL